MQHFRKNVKIVKFGKHIWIHHEKCIEISTNMPNIGLEIPEIGFDILGYLIKKMSRFVLVGSAVLCKATLNLMM